jgi:hypothetical protein
MEQILRHGSALRGEGLASPQALALLMLLIFYMSVMVIVFA